MHAEIHSSSSPIHLISRVRSRARLKRVMRRGEKGGINDRGAFWWGSIKRQKAKERKYRNSENKTGGKQKDGNIEIVYPLSNQAWSYQIWSVACIADRRPGVENDSRVIESPFSHFCPSPSFCYSLSYHHYFLLLLICFHLPIPAQGPISLLSMYLSHHPVFILGFAHLLL